MELLIISLKMNGSQTAEFNFLLHSISDKAVSAFEKDATRCKISAGSELKIDDSPWMEAMMAIDVSSLRLGTVVMWEDELSGS